MKQTHGCRNNGAMVRWHMQTRIKALRSGEGESTTTMIWIWRLEVLVLDPYDTHFLLLLLLLHHYSETSRTIQIHLFPLTNTPTHLSLLLYTPNTDSTFHNTTLNTSSSFSANHSKDTSYFLFIIFRSILIGFTYVLALLLYPFSHSRKAFIFII
ncbi:hypothetical protein RIF29_07928 [Crotalaria pallida]|uniref:Transmembrane protein n=1 Tax=Crotalaria pallida TaxID=3830 RepID=A0AAN9PB20_CROPI